MRIFHRKSRWQRLLEDLEYVSKNLDSVPKKPAIKNPAIRKPSIRVSGCSYRRCRAYCGECGRLVLSSEDERLERAPACWPFGVSGRPQQGGRA